MADYAAVSDLQAGWRPLSDEEVDRASTLIERAERRVRRLYPQTDARIASGELDVEEVADVICAMVRRVMVAGEHGEGVTQSSETRGPFGESRQYANPMGNLYLTADERAVLAVVSPRRAMSIPLWQT